MLHLDALCRDRWRSFDRMSLRIEPATLSAIAAFVTMRRKLAPNEQYNLIAEIPYIDILEGLQILMESLADEEDRRYAANMERWFLQSHCSLVEASPDG